MTKLYDFVRNYMILYAIEKQISAMIIVSKYEEKHLTEVLGAFSIPERVKRHAHSI